MGEYEQLRAARVAANRRRLEELELVPKLALVLDAVSQREESSAHDDVKRRKVEDKPRSPEARAALRRSARVVGKTEPELGEYRAGRARSKTETKVRIDKYGTSARPSSSELDVDLDLHVSDELRVFMSPNSQVKRFVVTSLCDNQAVAFQRMSGIVPFRNAVCLFVNLPDASNVDSVYENRFEPEGSVLHWFAQPTQTVESPMITRILAASTAAPSAGSTDRVLLFVRPPISHPDRAFYVGLGALVLRNVFPLESPVRFEFLLQSHAQLKQSPTFQAAVQRDYTRMTETLARIP
ncbi:hypothetical protein FVE85_2228 [Porphyridium purpureum]|uniref:Uncharacterized protein n=1 Tax=Porphyridium purpureum TaxID=35688 RepID=A0A5J4YZR9_PORPP|nr:hypothetical protein FVE85_2228 [Porphyridium purpureum]|eukprot:POR6203..scf209_3